MTDIKRTRPKHQRESEKMLVLIIELYCQSFMYS
nr:MAG TPA: hypothetical protein [Caudoviricetes sp.]